MSDNSHYHAGKVIQFVPRQTVEPEVTLTVRRRNGRLDFDYGDMSAMDKVVILFEIADAIRQSEREKAGHEVMASSAAMREVLSEVPAFFGKVSKRTHNRPKLTVVKSA